MTVDICVQHGGHELLRRVGLSAVADTCKFWTPMIYLERLTSRQILQTGNLGYDIVISYPRLWNTSMSNLAIVAASVFEISCR